MIISTSQCLRIFKLVGGLANFLKVLDVSYYATPGIYFFFLIRAAKNDLLLLSLLKGTLIDRFNYALFSNDSATL